MTHIQLEILEGNYWEHFKFAKDLALIFPVDDPKRKKIEVEMNSMLDKINEIKKKLGDLK